MNKSNNHKTPNGLIVDDDVTWTTPLKLKLESYLGAQIKVCGQGDAGLISIMTKKPSFIVLDWMMPGVMNGPAVLSIIRQKQSMIDVPVMVATSRDGYDDIKRMLELGADDYVCKPTSLRKIGQQVGAMLVRTKAQKGAARNARVFSRNVLAQYPAM